jgi:hypothetical protein
MTPLAPRVVIVQRRTELDELIAHHGTRGQAAFFLSTRGRDLGEVDERHNAQRRALKAVAAAIPPDWRRGSVERSDLDRFLFAEDDIVVIVGQDGLVANVAKYLDGQPVIGVNTDPGRNPGVLVNHEPGEAAELLRSHESIEERTMVRARTDDGQFLLALNEIFVGHPSHQTARYTLRAPTGEPQRQASSGLIVATGTGSTGWCRSAWLQRQSVLALPAPTETMLLWFVREAWPSPATGTSLTEGFLDESELCVDVESDGLVAFGDGMESDAMQVAWGQTVRLDVAPQHLRLVT